RDIGTAFLTQLTELMREAQKTSPEVAQSWAKQLRLGVRCWLPEMCRWGTTFGMARARALPSSTPSVSTLQNPSRSHVTAISPPAFQTTSYLAPP
ncbi:hypothetical protein BD311DRAFT_676862, partial [Dichomitus squalens]